MLSQDFLLVGTTYYPAVHVNSNLPVVDAWVPLVLQLFSNLSLRLILTLSIYPGVEPQDYVAMLFLNVLRTGCVLSPDTAVPFYIPPPTIQGFLFFPLHFSPSFFLSSFPSFFLFLSSLLLACHNSNMLMGVGWFFLILGVSLVIRAVEHLCMFPLGT